jgi:hypothetical protein
LAALVGRKRHPDDPSYVLKSISDWIRGAEQHFRVTELERELQQARQQAEQAEAELIAFRDSEAISIIGQEAYLSGLRVRQEALESVREELTHFQRTASAAVVPELTQGAFTNLWSSQQSSSGRSLS